MIDLPIIKRLLTTDLREFDRAPESFTVLRMLATPEFLAADRLPWIVLNAPRPLLGHKTWEGEWGHGRHYAAIDPADSLAPVYLRKSLELDGWVVEYVGQAEIDAFVDGMCEKFPRYAEHYREAEPEDQRRSYFNSHGKIVVKVGEIG